MAIKVGTTNNDELTGTATSDTLYGLAGNDVLSGGVGNDILNGGVGGDILIGGLGWDTFLFTSLEDFTPTNIFIDGIDVIADLGYGDKIAFNIQDLSYIGYASFSGVAGQYRFDNEGTLTFDFNGDKVVDSAIAIQNSLGYLQFVLRENIAGSNQLSIVINKSLIGTSTADTLKGSSGYDTLLGNAGNDILLGGKADDTLNGGDGADLLIGGLGQDDLIGGAGNDVFRYDSLAEMGDRIIDLTRGDKINLSRIKNLSFVGTGNDFSGVANQISVGNGYLQIDTDGDKNADYSSSIPYSLNIEETHIGSRVFQVAADKVLNGTRTNNTLIGGNGNDTLNGNGGADKLIGGAVNDTLNGGDGADTLIGGGGVDNLTGGLGNDTFKYNSLSEMGDFFNHDTITDLAVGDRINLSAITELKFVGFGNSFTSGTANTVSIYNDSVGTYIVIDTNGDNSIDYALSLPSNLLIEEATTGSLIFQIVENKTFNGTALNNTLKGGNGNDVLNGNAGNDILIGGYGGDTLTGGLGVDTFKYNSLAEIGWYQDTITDITNDKIDLSTIVGLKFVGVGNSFTGVANQVRIYNNYQYQQSQLEVDANGDGDNFGDYVLKLPGNVHLEETAPGSLIFQAFENKVLTGTAVNDTLIGGKGYDTLTGNAGNDWLSGGVSTDVLNGGDGADVLVGGLGADSLTGGSGNDTFKYHSLAEMGDYRDYYGHDTITDLTVGDKIDLSAIAGLTFAGVDKGFTGVVNQVSADYDSLRIDTNGDMNEDYILNLPYNLRIQETAANSLVFQIIENKVLNGTTANDILTGGNGNDTLKGGDGSDTLVGGLGRDSMTGGIGADVFKYNSLAEVGWMDDSFSDFSIGDKIDLSAMTQLSFVGIGNDFSGLANQVRTFAGSQLAIDINGDKSQDYFLSVASGYSPMEETTPGSLIFQMVENKILNGTTANDTLTGANGNDTLNGLGGNDSLIGGSGADTLDGGDGNDTLVGSLGADNLTGGAGADIFQYNSVAEVTGTITDLTVGDRVNLSAITGLSFVGVGNNFTGVANQISIAYSYLQIDTNGDKQSDYYLLLPYNLNIEETVVGSNIFRVVENQTLNGTIANDTLTGGNGNDTLNGLGGNDSLVGGYGDDTLNGGNGADILFGGSGLDNLTGGAGNDIFKYSLLAECQCQADTITDLSVGDKIDLSAIDANSQLAGDQKFSFFVKDFYGFTGVAGELIYTSGTLYGDVNGDYASDFTITLSGTYIPNSSNFIL